MLAQLSWMKDFVNAPLTPREAARALTASGSNVESVKDDVLEIEVTPNRGDCLSIVGMAREFSAATGHPLSVPFPVFNETGEPASQFVSVEIKAPDMCPRYAARFLRNVKIGPSPDWMKERLIAAGLRPINVAVDVTNYVMLERGQPLHAFDYRQVKDGKIIVRRAHDGERFFTLDGQERELDASILVICDAERSIAVAGVMGGLNSEIADDTTEILLESAHFDAVSIRAAAKKLGISTDASYRFERGVDPSGVIDAADRAAQLLQELAGAEIAPGVAESYPKVIEPEVIAYRPERGDLLASKKIPADDQRRYLESLGFSVQTDGERFLVTIPTSRPDISQEDDLGEEVARLYGFDRIPYRLPSGSFFGKLSESQTIVNQARRILKECDLQEVFTHSYTNPSRLMRFSEIPPVRLLNPLSEEFAALRTNLLSLLADLAERNARQGRKDINVFETGLIYLPRDEGTGVEERLRAGGLLCGSRMSPARWNLKPAPLEADFYAAKGVVETLLRGFGILEIRCEPIAALGLHPGRCAKILLGDDEIGIVGQIDPELQATLELPGDAYVFEINLEFLRAARRSPHASPLPKYPSISRDVAMLAPKTVAADEILRIIQANAGPYLEEGSVFDVYEGEGIPEGRKSIAYSLSFRSPERTLTDQEADDAIAAIRDALKTEADATPR